MSALLRFHLRRVFSPLLLFVLAAFAAYMLFTYRAGGAWMGQAFGYSTALQLWQFTTTVLVLFLALISPPPRAANREGDPLYLVRPSLRWVVMDRIARFIALMAPFVLIGIVLSLYMTTRVPDAVHMYLPPPFQDPLTAGAVWQIFLLGPLPGVALLLAIGEALGLLSRSNLLRLLWIGSVLIVDGINRLTSPWLSPSGTALSIQQSRVGFPPCAPVYTIDGNDLDFCALPALWGDYLFSTRGGALIGPVTTDVAPDLVMARVTLGALSLLVVLASAWWHHRHLRATT